MRRVALALLFGLLPGSLSAASPQTAFRPGAIWPDNKGVHVNAHGGGILVHDGVFYASEDNGTLQISQFMADQWRPKNAIDGRHLRLPIQFKDGRPLIEWMDEWDLSFFDRAAGGR